MDESGEVLGVEGENVCAYIDFAVIDSDFLCELFCGLTLSRATIAVIRSRNAFDRGVVNV